MHHIQCSFTEKPCGHAPSMHWTVFRPDGNDAGAANTTNAEEDGILNDSHWRLHDYSYGDGGGDDDDDVYDDTGCEVSGTGRATARKNRRWEPLEEQRLLAWRREKKPWKWIFDQFPDRTEATVCVRLHMLQQPAQRAD